MKFVTDCVHSTAEHIEAMLETEREITYQTFTRHVPLSEVGPMLGYGREFPLRKDWHVRYFKSRYKGKPCYFIVHSAIEYIFQEVTA